MRLKLTLVQFCRLQQWIEPCYMYGEMVFFSTNIGLFFFFSIFNCGIRVETMFRYLQVLNIKMTAWEATAHVA